MVPACKDRRWRRRGPRSIVVKLRRALPKRCRALPGISAGEAAEQMPENSIDNSQPHSCKSSVYKSALIKENPNARRQVKKEEISILVLNIQSLRAHLAELEFH